MNIIKLNATESTNNFMKSWARVSEPEDETVVTTDNQMSGRGQRENSWYSKSGESLTMSLFKRFSKLEIQNHFLINMAVSIGVWNVLNQLEVPRVKIKWPNDIMSENKKIGGILIENILRLREIKHSVVGIGINVNNTVFENLPQAGSMKIQTNNIFDIDELIDLLSEACFKELRKIESSNVEVYQQTYEKILFRKNETSEFENSKKERFEAEIMGITKSGELLLKTPDNTIKQIRVKELKMIY